MKMTSESFCSLMLRMVTSVDILDIPDDWNRVAVNITNVNI